MTWKPCQIKCPSYIKESEAQKGQHASNLSQG